MAPCCEAKVDGAVSLRSTFLTVHLQKHWM